MTRSAATMTKCDRCKKQAEIVAEVEVDPCIVYFVCDPCTDVADAMGLHITVLKED